MKRFFCACALAVLGLGAVAIEAPAVVATAPPAEVSCGFGRGLLRVIGGANRRERRRSEGRTLRPFARLRGNAC